MATVPPEILQQVPGPARDAFTAAYAEDPLPVEHQRARIEAHVTAADNATHANEFVDQHLAHVIADRLGKALDEWDGLDDHGRRLLHAAVAYYALREDAEDDMSSVIGFEDDAQVVNVCLRAIGLADLEIDLE